MEMSSIDDMYPPPGSCQYKTPKPVRNGTVHRESEVGFLDLCRSCGALVTFFKPKFWKLIAMVLLVMVIFHFYNIFIFRQPFTSLFTISERKKLNRFVNISKASPILPDESTLGERSDSKSLNGTDYAVYSTKNQRLMHPGKYGSRELLNRSQPGTIKSCPPVPPALKGNIKPILEKVPNIEIQEKSHPELVMGGRYRPKDCKSRTKVAVIIPFRDRAAHLAIFLYNIHPFLQRQQIDYAIYLIEQAGSGKFNRAMLMNVGSLESLKLYDYDCFIFHDVDLIPEDDRNLYTCPKQPRHMSVAINTMGYKLPYIDIFGGVSAMTVAQFKKVNGFSNRFWGWGGEDDDMSNRIKYHDLHISRYPANIARYTMISHKKDKPNPLRFKFLKDGKKKFKVDGLSNINYKILDIQLRRLYTWIYVDLRPPKKKL